MRHPEHDRLRGEVRSWYRASSPQMGYRGYHIEHRRFGYYRSHPETPDAGGPPHHRRDSHSRRGARATRRCDQLLR